MTIRLRVDYNEKLRKGDEVPADKGARWLRMGLAEEVVDESVVEPLPEIVEHVATEDRVSVPVAPKRRVKAAK